DRGNIPVNFRGWVWQIARNRYSLWAAKKHKKASWEQYEDISEYELESESESPEEELIQNEALLLLRRELAYISSEYRNLLVSYYIENKKLSVIAATAGLPVGTVKSNLFRARKILKEGMNMAREYGIRSYKPDDVHFIASGRQEMNRPWGVVQRKLPKNILLEADNNPSTLEELAVELGTAMPYLEEEVEILKDATLLKKNGDKYITNFFIASKECQTDIYQAQRRDSKKRSRLLEKIIADSLDKIRALGVAGPTVSDNNLKWWLSIHAVDCIVETIPDYSHLYPEKRENGETWGFMGMEMAVLPEDVMVGHNGCGNENVELWAYKVGDYGLWNVIGEMYDSLHAVFLADAIRAKRKVADFTSAEKKIWDACINNIHAHEGENGEVVPDILVATKEQMDSINDILLSHPLAEELKALFAQAFEETKAVIKKNISPQLSHLLDYCASMFILNTRMMTVHDLVETNTLLIPEDPENSKIGLFLIIR
ncbi:MAG: sigma-70 family RNA polymerase sigma factor, partial [Clostridia bacterium]|nr:sigma-70 family RNA polymerase sigma factor [Clostridia bacterium]